MHVTGTIEKNTRLWGWIMEYVDAYGAPEFLVDDVAFRTMVGNDYVRFGYYTQEPGEKILRMKLVFPVRRLIEAQDETRQFVALQRRCHVDRVGVGIH